MLGGKIDLGEYWGILEASEGILEASWGISWRLKGVWRRILSVKERPRTIQGRPENRPRGGGHPMAQPRRARCRSPESPFIY